MITSTSITQLTKALIAFHDQIGTITKDAANPFFKSSYASLSNILDSIKSPLAASGLTFVQFPDGENGLTTRLMHESGEWMEATYPMKPAKSDPQGLGSAITYQRRYSLGAILGLNIDTDDDGNAASTSPEPERYFAPKKNYKQLLEATPNAEELKRVWATLPAEVKVDLEEVKNELKLKHEVA
jgi:ERF superfamily